VSADEAADASRNCELSPKPDQRAIPFMMTTQSYMPAWANFEDRWPYAEMIMGFDQRNTPLVLRQAATYTQPQEHSGQNGSASIFVPAVGIQGESRPVRIARAPAGRLESALRFILAREAFQRIVAPCIADAHHEYFEDLLRKDLAHAQWVVVRLYLTIGYNVLWALVAPALGGAGVLELENEG
jgi:hypothetical protein